MDKRICGIVRHCTITGSIGKDPDAGKDGRQKKRAAEDKKVGWHHQFDGHELR